MKNKTRVSFLKSNKKMLVLMISLALAILIASGSATYAIFTNSLHAQRTVAAYELASDKFSSNYLSRGLQGSNLRTIYVTSYGQTPTGVISVCNYDQGKQTQPNGEDISYTVSLRLVKKDGGGNFVPATASDAEGYTATITKGVASVTLNNSNLSDSSTFSGAITGGAAHSDSYTLALSPNFAATPHPNMYVEMTVTPTQPSSLPTLTGIFQASVRAAGATNSWTGSFRDSDTSSPSDYDGFNYRVEGQGSGTFTLKWNNAKVELSQVSLAELLSIVGATSTSNSVTFPVDSGVANMYDLQFYKVNITNEAWNQMNSELGAAGDSPSTVVGYYFAG